MMRIGFYTKAVTYNHASRNPYYSAIIRHIFEYNGAGADFYVITDIDVPKHLGATGNHDIVTDGWMTLAAFFAGPAQGYSLIKGHIFTNNSRFSDYNATAVVYKKTFAKLGTRVDFHLGKETRHLR